jgi:hypothetical protein
VLFVSLVEGFLEWINQYWKECPWSSAGNCFTLFSSLFSIFLPALHISYKGGFCFLWLEWVIEISDKPGEEEPEPAFKVNDLLQPYACMQCAIYAVSN